jgi:hypothetical protein
MKSLILTFNVTRLKAGTLSAFLQSFIAFAIQAGEQALRLDTLLPQLREAWTLLNQLVLRQEASIITPEITRLDKERDKYFRLLVNETKAKLKSPADDVRQTAEKVWQIARSYSHIDTKEMPKESTIITTLCSLLLTDEVRPLLDALSLTADVEALQKSNDGFITAFELRIQDTATKRPSPATSTAQQKKVCIDLYRECVQTVNALATLDATPEVQNLVSLVNIEIGKYRRYTTSRTRRTATGTDKNDAAPTA